MRYLCNVLIGVGLLFMTLAAFFAMISTWNLPLPDTGESVMVLAIAVAGAGTGMIGVLLRLTYF